MSIALSRALLGVRSTVSLFAFAFAIALMAACGGTSMGGEVPTPTGACSPAEAPFAKVTNPATSDEFSSCAITTEAEFLSADWGVVVGGDVEGQVKWSAAVPGTSDMKFMFVPKTTSDAIFALKKGERVKVTGSTSRTMVGQVIFYATDITKLEPKAAP
ncbi:MAG: hypothetical protein U0414_31765 [Polyangiaceae bacterium]